MRDMFENQEEMDPALENETNRDTSSYPTASENRSQVKKRCAKGFSQSLMRLFKQIRLHNVVLAANGELCAIALILHKLLLQTDPEIITGIRLIYPSLSAQLINTQMANSNGSAPNTNKKITAASLHIVVEKDHSRVDMLRYFFPQLTVSISEPNTSIGVLAMCHKEDGDLDFDPNYCNCIGKSLFLSLMTVEMNVHTKQYDRNYNPITDRLTKIMQPKPEECIPTKRIEWDTCERHVGALLLRGNRCVLVRSTHESE